MEEIKKPMYAYVKGGRYNFYRVKREQDEELKEINEEFETFNDLIQWVYQFSNLYSIPVQFYI